MPRKKLYSVRAFHKLVDDVADCKGFPYHMTLEGWTKSLAWYATWWESFLAQDRARERLGEQRTLDPEAVAFIESHLDTHVGRIVSGLKRIGMPRKRSWVSRVRRLIFDARRTL